MRAGRWGSRTKLCKAHLKHVHDARETSVARQLVHGGRAVQLQRDHCLVWVAVFLLRWSRFAIIILSIEVQLFSIIGYCTKASSRTPLCSYCDAHYDMYTEKWFVEKMLYKRVFTDRRKRLTKWFWWILGDRSRMSPAKANREQLFQCPIIWMPREHPDLISIQKLSSAGSLMGNL